jgi:hypothetical protein
MSRKKYTLREKELRTDLDNRKEQQQIVEALDLPPEALTLHTAYDDDPELGRYSGCP